MRHVGRSLPRPDDASRARGRARFASDVTLPRELHLRLVRSPVAFGTLRGIDTSAAAALAGVVAILTAEDLAAVPPIPVRHGAQGPLEQYLQPVLAGGTLRYVGEPVTAVLAETAGIAEDAAELVALAIVAQPPHLSLTGAPPVTDPARAVEAASVRRAFGDLNGAFHAADRIVEVAVGLARDGAVPLETRASIAAWDTGSETLTLWTVARSAHATRDTLAAMLTLPRAAVRVETFARGGGAFLVEELSPEDVLVAFAARKLERPVRWVEDRREHLLAAPQSRGLRATARAAVKADGTLLGMDVEYALNQGAYVRPEGAMVADLLAASLPGPYRLDAFRARGRIVLTNRPPAGAFGSAGRAEATFVRERLMDAVASELGLPPMDVRRRNLTPAGPMLAGRRRETLGSPLTDRSGCHEALIDAATKRFGLDALRRRCADRRDRGDLVGLGQALFVEAAGPGAFEHVVLSVDRAGNVELVTGAAPDGRGMATELAQIVADIVGVDYDRVRVTFGDTIRIPFGSGAQAARAFATVAAATQHAAEALRDEILAGARQVTGTAEGRFTIQSGRIRDADRNFGSALELGELAEALEPSAPDAGRDARGLVAEGSASDDAETFPYGLAVAMVEVDRLTGLVRVPRAFVAYEAGNAINPALIELRLAADVVDGVSAALRTRFDWSPGGDPLTADFADYAMPSAAEAPAVEVLVLDQAPPQTSPLGILGAGESSLAGMAAAVAAAIDAAVSTPGFVTALPVAPSDVLAHVKGRRTVPSP